MIAYEPVWAIGTGKVATPDVAADTHRAIIDTIKSGDVEAACEARLLHRSTHGLSLTDEGATFLAHGRRLLDTTADLHSELSGKTGGPAGWVRVSVSSVLARPSPLRRSTV